MKTMILVPVETNASATPEEIRATVQCLIDAGLADACDTLESNEGNGEAAQLATDLNIAAPVPIPYDEALKKAATMREYALFDKDTTTGWDAAAVQINVRNAFGMRPIEVAAQAANVEEFNAIRNHPDFDPAGAVLSFSRTSAA
jgi:hypothetical protein